MLDEYETLQFQGVFTDDQPGKFFKTHNITNNKKTLIPPPPPKKKKNKPSLGTYALQGILFHLEHLWLA